eukprot:comp22239_c0_seq1/m.32804 comp22239_c0_seq1/g.32804  ORF comp22239_c0_seq1/g.32804 comp22239_c0_seq1/m.32804 type:complete len:623 (-) comp22239_c0_seq1:171-2039(-)
MIDLFAVFTTGGIVLWTYTGPYATVPATGAVNALINEVLVEKRGVGGAREYTHGSFLMKWVLANEYELVFVVVIQKELQSQLSYLDDLLERARAKFSGLYKQFLVASKSASTYVSPAPDQFSFDDEFRRIDRDLEVKAREQKSKPREMRSFDNSRKKEKLERERLRKMDDESGAESGANSPAIPSSPRLAVPNEDEDAGRKGRNRLSHGGKKESKSPIEGSPQATKPQKSKAKREWHGVDGVTGKAKAKDFDYSGEGGSEEAANQKIRTLVSEVEGRSMVGDVRDLEEDSEPEEVGPAATQASKGLTSGISSFFQGLTGNKDITEADVEPMLSKYRDHLIGKNVAANVATDLCEGLKHSLVGQKMSTLLGVNSVVQKSLSESLTRILQPKRRIDILRDVLETRKAGRPYIITMCGVNGVGKSTNLAKVCYWLLQNGYSVLIAACDTFRSGAVEQLRVHQRALSEIAGGLDRVMLFERGYGKDAADIAAQAIAFAKERRMDVVLVDTAGRMQDNEPLMRSLAKLVKVNQPDLVLFVGEALVGNEAVDQLVKFNQALADYSDSAHPRLVDGIILSKFDTIDDKVGAAISMTYTTGQPVVFVGVGQTYTDLRRLNVKAVVHALLK